MLGTSKKQFKLKTLFLHFLYLSKVNKERRYINRNGKMPQVSEAEEEKKGYKSVYMITLRKFLTGFFHNGEGNSTKLKILKSRSFDGHEIYPDGGKYEYGTSDICDSLVRLSFFDHFLPNRFNPNFTYKNHNFDFNRSGYVNSGNVRSAPFKITYKWDLESKDQTFAPVALDKYLEYCTNSASGAQGIQDREIFAQLSTKLFDKMRRESMFRTTSRSEGRTREVSTGSIGGVSTKYGVPRSVIQGFLEKLRETKEATVGFEDPQIFEYTKNISVGDHPKIREFEYNDFERLAA